MPITPAIFGIENGTLNTVVQLVLLGVVVIWLALVWYTFADARRRLDDGLLVGSATLAALVFPFIGTLVYMIVRPPEYLEDVRERELEMQAAEARLFEHQLCPHCDHIVGRDFLRCPYCLRKLRDTCTGCTKPLDPDWMICPYCETEIPGITPQRRSSRRRRDTLEAYEEPAGEPVVTEPDPAYGDPYAEAPAPVYEEPPVTAYDELPGTEPGPRSQP
jgi:RNA polymerase subunit RPABC4/transcription elongation factor Spt4